MKNGRGCNFGATCTCAEITILPHQQQRCWSTDQLAHCTMHTYLHNSTHAHTHCSALKCTFVHLFPLFLSINFAHILVLEFGLFVCLFVLRNGSAYTVMVRSQAMLRVQTVNIKACGNKTNNGKTRREKTRRKPNFLGKFKLKHIYRASAGAIPAHCLYSMQCNEINARIEICIWMPY